MQICAYRNFLPPLTRPKSTVGFLEKQKVISKLRNMFFVNALRNIHCSLYLVVILRLQPSRRVLGRRTPGQRCLQTAEHVFLPMPCETLFVCSKLIYRLLPAQNFEAFVADYYSPKKATYFLGKNKAHFLNNSLTTLLARDIIFIKTNIYILNARY